jgi:quercetin dioxygenase-like cupin family protein
MMPKRSKPPGPAPDVLDPELEGHLSAAMAPAVLSQADRDRLHGRIMQRIRGATLSAGAVAAAEGAPRVAGQATAAADAMAAGDAQPAGTVPTGEKLWSGTVAAVEQSPAGTVAAGEQAPAGTVTIRAADMRWVAAGPGVEVKVLRHNAARRDQTVLIRMQPGAVVVGHRHTQEEECLVLEGEVFVGDHRLGAGDMHGAVAGVVHAPIRAPHGALLMIRSEMPPQHFKIA